MTKLVPPLLTAASIHHALRCSCAERDSNFNLRRQNEAVRSDGRDSRGLPQTCERRDWRIRDPTWRKRDPTWRKSDPTWRKSEFCWRICFYSLQYAEPLAPTSLAGFARDSCLAARSQRVMVRLVLFPTGMLHWPRQCSIPVGKSSQWLSAGDARR